MSNSTKNLSTGVARELEDLETGETAVLELSAEDAEAIHGRGTTAPTQKTTTSTTTKPFEITDFSFGTG